MNAGKSILKSLKILTITAIFCFFFICSIIFKNGDNLLQRLNHLFAILLFLSSCLFAITYYFEGKNRTQFFLKELWQDAEFLPDKGLYIKLTIGTIFIPEAILSSTVESTINGYYLSKIPYFDWTVEIKRDIIPYKLRVPFLYSQKSSSTRSKQQWIFNTKNLNFEQKKLFRNHIIMQGLFLILYFLFVSIIIYPHSLADISKIDKRFIGDFILIFTCICVSCFSILNIMNEGNARQFRQLGLPTVHDDYYQYNYDGIITRLNKDAVSLDYNTKKSLLTTKIKSFTYVSKVYFYTYKKFKDRN